MNNVSENLAIALIYLGFFGLLGWAVWTTNNAWPLWALVLLPAIKLSGSEEKKDGGTDS